MGLLGKLAKAVAPVAGKALGNVVLPGIGGEIGAALGTGLSAALGGKGVTAAELTAQNAALQREFAQHGIQWRVEDAKRAGVHPLFALGAGGAAYAPSAVSIPAGPDLTAMGQNLARAAGAGSTALHEEMMRAQIAMYKAAAAKDNALALQAAGATAAQPAASIPIPSAQVGPVDMTGFMDRSVSTPVEVPSTSSAMPGVAAGPAAPGMYLYHVPGVGGVLLPGRDIGEALESLSDSALLMGVTYKINKNVFGDGWAENFFRRAVPYGDVLMDVHGGIERYAEPVRSALVRGAEWLSHMYGDRSYGPQEVKGKIRYPKLSGDRYYDFRRARWIYR